MEDAYIYDTVRSPRGRGKKGSLNELTAVALSAKILKELREKQSSRKKKSQRRSDILQQF